MSNVSGVPIRGLGAILLVGLALFSGYGFLASDELGFPNVWHVIYGTAGVAALLGAAWLAIAASKVERHRGTYWRPSRLAALFSLFSLAALTTGDLANLWFLLFLLFLIPIPAKLRTQP